MYVVLSSFLPKGGQILSVAVYPSEFGLQRMKEEELHGPVGLFDGEQKKNDEDDDDDNDDEEMDNEKLRAYEMSRLRYCTSVLLFIFMLKFTYSSFEFLVTIKVVRIYIF